MRSFFYPAVLAGVMGALQAGCVDELVVGLRQPLQALDGGPGLDATVTDDASTWEDAAGDASLPIDGSQPAVDAGPDDAACGSPRCGDSSYGPCYSCNVVINFNPAGTCANGAVEACWDDGDGTCKMQCPDVDACKTTSDCAANEYCFFPQRDCGLAAAALGVCAPRPTSCDDFKNPTCACDGLVYPSLCQALLAGHDIPSNLNAACK